MNIVGHQHSTRCYQFASLCPRALNSSPMSRHASAFQKTVTSAVACLGTAHRDNQALYIVHRIPCTSICYRKGAAGFYRDSEVARFTWSMQSPENQVQVAAAPLARMYLLNRLRCGARRWPLCPYGGGARELDVSSARLLRPCGSLAVFSFRRRAPSPPPAPLSAAAAAPLRRLRRRRRRRQHRDPACLNGATALPAASAAWSGAP